jgi:hypothetical protein
MSRSERFMKCLKDLREQYSDVIVETSIATPTTRAPMTARDTCVYNEPGDTAYISMTIDLKR